MARRVRIKMNREGIIELMAGTAVLGVVKAKGDAIAAACNEQSTWGGYASEASTDGVRARARVWSFDDRNDEARDQRLVRNLDA